MGRKYGVVVAFCAYADGQGAAAEILHPQLTVGMIAEVDGISHANVFSFWSLSHSLLGGEEMVILSSPVLM
ncbi:hypothetical protein [Stenotrophomonas rhizophila]|uniref:hypothetical protein n=1 Tax=Stenotrophomonas rhizophila TaxID=216778 RepID=UPI00112F6CE9|nr:hypothetical protein [Stenotrophomonas rhizophila]